MNNNNQFSQALFLSKKQKRLSRTALDFVGRSIGWQGRLEVSAGVLRNTAIANMIAAGSQLPKIGYWAGIKRWDLLTRYCADPVDFPSFSIDSQSS